MPSQPPGTTAPSVCSADSECALKNDSVTIRQSEAGQEKSKQREEQAAVGSSSGGALGGSKQLLVAVAVVLLVMVVVLLLLVLGCWGDGVLVLVLVLVTPCAQGRTLAGARAPTFARSSRSNGTVVPSALPTPATDCIRCNTLSMATMMQAF